MARVKVKISQPLQDLPGAIKQGLAIGRTGAGNYAKTIIRQQIQLAGAVASKELLNSITEPDISPDGRSTKVGTKAKQGFWIEFGRKAGAFLRWQQAKVILSKWAKNKGLGFSPSRIYFTWKKIMRQGYKAREPFKKARAAMAPGVARIFKDAIGKAVTGQVSGRR